MSGRPVSYIEQKVKKLFQQLASTLSIPGELRTFALPTPPTGWLEADGSSILIADYPALAAAIYCGNANNGTAAWGYKVNGGGSRDTAGTKIVLPDFRGEFIRGWDHGRGKDSGRSIYASQADAFKAHLHTGITDSKGAHTHTGSANTGGAHVHQYNRGSVVTIDNTTGGGAQNRVVSYSEFTDSTGSGGGHGHTLAIDGVADHFHNLTINETGESETRPTNLAALICIKT